MDPQHLRRRQGHARVASRRRAGLLRSRQRLPARETDAPRRFPRGERSRRCLWKGHCRQPHRREVLRRRPHAAHVQRHPALFRDRDDRRYHARVSRHPRLAERPHGLDTAGRHAVQVARPDRRPLRAGDEIPRHGRPRNRVHLRFQRPPDRGGAAGSGLDHVCLQQRHGVRRGAHGAGAGGRLDGSVGRRRSGPAVSVRFVRPPLARETPDAGR